MAKAKHFSIRHQPGFTAIAATCFFLLYFPIFVLVIYAFNASTSTSAWGGLSLQPNLWIFNSNGEACWTAGWMNKSPGATGSCKGRFGRI